MKRSARTSKVSPNEEKRIQIDSSPLCQQKHEYLKFNALSGKMKQLKIAKQLSGAPKEKENESTDEDSKKFKKIDFHCCIAYFLGYCVFNFFYWIDMLFY